MSKLKEKLIKMVSSEGDGDFYTTTKNRKNTPDKLELKKYNKKLRKHVMYKETKLK